MTDYIPAEGQTAYESVEQQFFFEWAALEAWKHPELRLLYHIPNEGKRSARQGARMRAEGLRAGVPDICLPVPRGGYSALYIELKAGRNKPTPDQLAWLDALDKAGNKTAVCWGWQSASKAVVEYLEG